MKQQIKAMLEEDRGVSPVIGVILMVAITVILAAVIGTFVLGLGDSLQQAPQAQLDAEGSGSASGDSLELTISHNGGDSIEVGDLRVTVETGGDVTLSSSEVTGDDGEFGVGDAIELDDEQIDNSDDTAPTGDTQIQVIHTPSESIILDTEVTFEDS